MNIPYVIEGNENKERVYDLFSRLMKDRIIVIGQAFTDQLANIVISQLLFLEADDHEKDIVIYINSPGGSVSSCLAIYDTINYISCDVSTVCIGQAASAGSFILAAGTKGKRYALKNSRIMIHQLSSGYNGQIDDMKIHYDESNKLNNVLLEEMSLITGHKTSKLKKDMARDKFMSSYEAVEYGIIDDVLVNRRR
jgi:ATP-dependent Clp protease protease subunit